MLIKQYTSDSAPVPEDVDLVNEFSTVRRSKINGEDDVEYQFSVKYQPNEFVRELVDEEWEDSGYISPAPIETTVMVVGEGEIIDRESVIEAKNLQDVR